MKKDKNAPRNFFRVVLRFPGRDISCTHNNRQTNERNGYTNRQACLFTQCRPGVS